MKDGRLTITDWQKGQALSPFLGFATMRNCEVFDNPGIVKIAKQAQENTNISATSLPVARVVASTGDVYTLTMGTSGGISPAFRKNDTVVTSITGGTFAYDMVEYNGYIVISYTGGLFTYQMSTGRITQAFKTGLTSSYWIDLLVGQDNILYIGNGNNVATITNFVAGTVSTDPTGTLNSSALDLPDGQYVVCLAELGRNLLVGTQGGTSWSQRGALRVANIYPWDRTSASFSLPVQIQENAVHAMISVNNTTYVCAGTAGNIYVTDGTSYRKIGRIPWSQDRNISNSVGYYPNAITTNVNNNLLIGVSLYSGSAEQLGVYEMALSEGYPICLKQVISTGNFNTNIQIGFVTTSSNGVTNIGWQDGTDYGVDYTLFNAYVGYKAVIESPLYSVGTSTNKKTFQHGEFILAKPLTYQQQIRISYRKDTESDYVVIGTYSFSALGSKRSHLFTPHIADAENVQIKIELDQNEYTSPNPTNWDLELMSISLW